VRFVPCHLLNYLDSPVYVSDGWLLPLRLSLLSVCSSIDRWS
jgi:hypothetical protein